MRGDNSASSRLIGILLMIYINQKLMFVVLVIIHHIFLVISMQAENLNSFLEGVDNSEFPL